LVRACQYDPTKGKTNDKVAQLPIDWILPHEITWRPYEDYTDVTPFDDVALYFGWIKSGPTKGRYLSERVMRYFGYVQSVSRHPQRGASIVTIVEQID
jgi:hypothetical protein